MRKPTMCGSNRIYMPTSGCGDCNALSAEDIEALTPIECYEPPCRDSRVCYGEVCCMVVSCNTSNSDKVCEGGVCYAQVGCEQVDPLDVKVFIATSGDQLGVNYIIKNTTDADITNVECVSNIFGNMETFTVIEPNESVEIDGIHVATEEEKEYGSIAFIFTATGTQNGETLTTTKISTVVLSTEEASEE